METAQSLSNPMSRIRESEGLKWTDAVFEKLFLENYNRIVSVLFRLLGDRPRAEESANDVFLKLYRKRQHLNPGGNLGGWLYRTATNLGIDILRATARRKDYEQAAGQIMVEGGAPADPLREVLRAEKRSQVRATLARLKPAQAQILILRSSGFSYNELAEVLGIRRGSVGTMLARAEAEFQRRHLKLQGSKEEL